MKVIELVETMQLTCKRLSCDGKTIRLVPTMGSLHAGHASLIKRAIEDKVEAEAKADVTHAAAKPPPPLNGSIEIIGQSEPLNSGNVRGNSNDKPSDIVVVVSIFVNPLQFNDSNDFAKYPITREQDLALCKQLQVDYVFMPRCQDILNMSHAKSSSSSQPFKDNIGLANTSTTTTTAIGYGRRRAFVSRCTIRAPDELSRDLEGKSRGNHFEGMLTIVCKLFNIVQPATAYFGEKDYQQMVLVKKMVRDLSMQVDVRPVATVRDTSTMLPLSSRNVRLNREQQKLAATLMYGTLMNTKQALEDKCKRSIYDDRNGGDAPPARLDTVLFASLLASQCLIQSEYELLLLSGNNNTDDDDVGAGATYKSVTVDYFELRCANDLTVIKFDQAENLYNCQMGCCSGVNLNDRQDGILRARLLISIIVAKVRLLDNIEVQLNL